MSNNTPDDEYRPETTTQPARTQRRVARSTDTTAEPSADPAPYREIPCGTITGVDSNVRITTATDETPLTVTALRDAADATVDLRWATGPVSVGFALDIGSTRALISALQAAVAEVENEP